MVELKFITPYSDDIIESAGRICYNSSANGRPDLFVKSRVKEGHLSLGRHAIATFIIQCSRACAMQWLRHKFLDFSMKSQRYCNEANFKYITPPSIMENPDIDLDFADIMIDLNQAYKNLINKGVRKEDARFILPNACLTEFYVTGSFQAWYDFLKLRINKKAQWEIRRQAEEIGKILSEKSAFFYEFKEEVKL